MLRCLRRGWRVGRVRAAVAAVVRPVKQATGPGGRGLVAVLRLLRAGEGCGWVPRPWWVRAARVSRGYVAQQVRVHRGRLWRRLRVQAWQVGLPWGTYARPTAGAVFRRKSGAKRRRRGLGAGPGGLGLQVQRLRDVRAGLRRRVGVQAHLHEAGLRGVGA